MGERAPHCLTCRHIRIVPGHKHPHVCTLWGIRTGPSRYPSAAIFNTLGRHCPYHEAKPVTRKKTDARDTDDDSDLDITI